jgi:hypothetical protein
MRLGELVERLHLRRLTPDLVEAEDAQITAGYASDLLSDILANAPAGGVAVTIQAHLNTVAVAVHARLSAVILAMGREPEPLVVERAAEEGLPLYVSTLPTFDLVGRLWELGVRGTAK